MAGHSKWANIRHRKGAQDARRGRIFTKLIREITVASRMGGGVPADNPRLRAAMDKALTHNMSKDTIERAIRRGVGDEELSTLEELAYEGYASGGVAVLVETMTDNRNRTASDVRHAFAKHGGSLGAEGSVSYLFQRRAEIDCAATVDENELFILAAEAGADDVIADGAGGFEVHCSPDALESVRSAMRQARIEPSRAEVILAPSVEVDMDLDTAIRVMKLIDHLEELDDVQNVFTNARFTPELMRQLGEQ